VGGQCRAERTLENVGAVKYLRAVNWSRDIFHMVKVVNKGLEGGSCSNLGAWKRASLHGQ